MRANLAATPLLNRSEQLLYGRLVRAFPGHIILSRVELSRLLAGADFAPPRGGEVMSAPRLPSIADFVVCRSDFSALAVVEITIEPPRDTERERNRRRDRRLQSAGIKVIRLACHDLPDEAALKALVAAHPLHASTEQLVRRAS